MHLRAKLCTLLPYVAAESEYIVQLITMIMLPSSLLKVVQESSEEEDEDDSQSEEEEEEEEKPKEKTKEKSKATATPKKKKAPTVSS